MSRRLARWSGRIGVWLYRTTDGRVGGAHVLLLTSPGRRTGVPRSTCVRYLSSPDGLLVWGTGSGSPRDPDWFLNLRAAAVVDVQIGQERFRARPRELLADERDQMWQTILARAPEVNRYARKAGRTIPVAVLERAA